jgi:hypothetical protein
MIKTLVILVCATVAIRAENLSLGWTNNMLRISGPGVPGGFIDTWYLEAFCRSGSTDRDWNQTLIPHKTELVSASPHRLVLRTRVEPRVVIEHEIISGPDEVEFRLEARNEGDTFSDAQWFQPCMRVDRFTGANQTGYLKKSFIFTAEGLRTLDQLPRAEEAIYRGGQVYVPAGIPLEDVNPRPISSTRPVNNLIGCFSQDGEKILAAAWDSSQELFQGVLVCLHNDPRLGGMKPGERKKLLGKVYIVPNDAEKLLQRYRADFHSARDQREKTISPLE